MPFRFFIFAVLIFSSLIVYSQDFEKNRSLQASADFLQIKESLNYGLVYSGVQFKFSYRNAWEINGRKLIYQGDVGLAVLTTRSLTGLGTNFKPVDLTFFFYERPRDISILAGPWIKMEYNYELYPDLQSGYSFHYTNYTLGLALAGIWQTDDFHLKLQVKNSLFGLISRTESDRDPYFFNLNLRSYVSDQHRHFKGGSYGLYNNTEVEIQYIDIHHPRIGYSYRFQYFSYQQNPELKSLIHGFTVYFYPKSLK